MGVLTVDGDVIIPEDSGELTITAESIGVKAGSITAGSESQPHMHPLTFSITGQKNDRGLTLEPTAQGNKLFAITGKLKLYGPTPASTWNKLVRSAIAGDSEIELENAEGWTAGA